MSFWDGDNLSNNSADTQRAMEGFSRKMIELIICAVVFAVLRTHCLVSVTGWLIAFFLSFLLFVVGIGVLVPGYVQQPFWLMIAIAASGAMAIGLGWMTVKNIWRQWRVNRKLRQTNQPAPLLLEPPKKHNNFNIQNINADSQGVKTQKTGYIDNGK